MPSITVYSRTAGGPPESATSTPAAPNHQGSRHETGSADRSRGGHGEQRGAGREQQLHHGLQPDRGRPSWVGQCQRHAAPNHQRRIDQAGSPARSRCGPAERTRSWWRTLALPSPAGQSARPTVTVYGRTAGGPPGQPMPTSSRFEPSAGELTDLDGPAFPVVATCPAVFDVDFSGDTYSRCFRELLRENEITAGQDLGDTGQTSLNVEGTSGSTPTTWLTVYDATPARPDAGPPSVSRRSAPTCRSCRSTISRGLAWSPC